jgi:hypothetical protein
VRLFVAGEGVDEIGKWSEHSSYRQSSERGDGVLAELFRKKHPATVQDGKAWTEVSHFRAGIPRGDAHTLAALALAASEAGVDVLVWARDTDGDAVRVAELKSTQEELRREYPSLLFVGGLPHPAIEAWVIAIGDFDTDPESRSKGRLKELAKANDCASEAEMCRLIRERKLDGTERSDSLRQFVAQLEKLR